MIKYMSLLVAGMLSVGACNVEHYDECERTDFDYDDEFENGPTPSAEAGAPGTSAGSSTSGGNCEAGCSSSGGANAAGSANEGGSPEPMEPAATPCEGERDCVAGFNCDLETKECVAASEETCGELEGEGECAERSDCVPIYGGTNCSCGQDCECQGGEPGCICESFEFFVCRVAE